jgi:hypothetical protein
MANTVITPSIIAKVALAQLENNLVFGRSVYRDYDREFNKVGDTISIRRPVNFVANDGAVAITQDVQEGKLSLTLDKRKHVSWLFNTQDLTLSIEKYNERYIQPALIALANQIDYDGLQLYKKVWNWVGTPGTTLASYAGFAKAPLRLDEMAVPQDMRKAVLNPNDKWGLLGSQTSLYVQDAARDAYRRGDLGDIGGIMTSMDQNMATHTTGAPAGTPAINGASQNVTYSTSANTESQSLILKSLGAAGTVKEGDIFTIANVYAVNPKSKVSTGTLQQFVVRANGTADGSGNLTVTISPPIITSGAYQTVDSAPADSALVTFLGSASTAYRQNLVFHRNAFVLAMRDLEMPDGAAFKARESANGFSIRVLKWYDGENDEERIRLDVLYGWKAIYPHLATRLSGT